MTRLRPRRPTATATAAVVAVLLGLAGSSCAVDTDVARGGAAAGLTGRTGTAELEPDDLPAPPVSEGHTAEAAAGAAGGPAPAPLLGDAPEAARAEVVSPAATGAVAAPPEPAEVSHGLGVAATVAPSCVTVGDTVEIRITTEPGATLGLAAAFADHEPHGAMGFGEAGPDGAYVWRIVVPAGAPVGEATAVVGADLVGDGGARRTGHVATPFRVAGPGGCA